MSVVQLETRRNKIHPQKFALWISFASSMMVFMAFTSAYLVRQGQGNWLEFKLPDVFFLNTFIILASSITLHTAYNQFLKRNFSNYKTLLVVTFLLGIGFLIGQYVGWVQLANSGVPLTLNPSGDFIYVISGAHAMHIIGGLTAICIAMVHAFALPDSVTPLRKLRLEMTLSFWHFVDFLWLYLLVFIILQ